jgi:flavin-dependent dehydrogenase
VTVDVQLTVVGGGPVGLAAAIEARQRGIEVVVIEPRKAPIDKACGEGLMPGALRSLERLGVEPAGHDLAGIAYLQGHRRVEHRFRRGVGRGVRRTVLHAALSRRAEALGVPVVHARVDALEQTARDVTVRGPALDGIRSPWLLGCDGLRSTIRDLASLGGEPAPRPRRRFGLRRHMRVAPWTDLVEVHWASQAEIYVTPVDDETIAIGVLGPPGVDIDRALREAPQLQERMHDAEPDGSLLGAGPLLQRTRARTAGRVLLVGDASGYVDALTGEGLRVGFAQAHAAIDAVVNEDARGYERAWTQSTRDFRVLTSSLVAAARSRLRGRIVPAAARNPRLFGAVVDRLGR